MFQDFSEREGLRWFVSREFMADEVIKQVRLKLNAHGWLQHMQATMNHVKANNLVTLPPIEDGLMAFEMGEDLWLLRAFQQCIHSTKRDA